MSDPQSTTSLHPNSCPSFSNAGKSPTAETEASLDDAPTTRTRSSSNPSQGPPEEAPQTSPPKKLPRIFRAHLNRERGIRSKSDPREAVTLVWRGFLPFYKATSSFQLLSLAERKTLLLSLTLLQRETLAKRAGHEASTQRPADTGTIKGFFSNLQKKIDGVSQRINGILEVGIVREIERKTSRAEIINTLKYSLTAEVG